MYLFFTKDEARQLLELLRSASKYPGRTRRMALSPTADPVFSPDACRTELTIRANPEAANLVAVADLRLKVMELILHPSDDTRLHQGMRDVIADRWDFSIELPVLNLAQDGNVPTIAAVFL